MRRLAVRVTAALAGVVYELGCKLYWLSDRLDGWDGTASDDTDLTEDDLAVMWNNGEPATTATPSTVTITQRAT